MKNIKKHKKFLLKEQLLYKLVKGWPKLYVPNVQELKQMILREHHEIEITVHLVIEKTLELT